MNLIHVSLHDIKHLSSLELFNIYHLRWTLPKVEDLYYRNELTDHGMGARLNSSYTQSFPSGLFCLFGWHQFPFNLGIWWSDDMSAPRLFLTSCCENLHLWDIKMWSTWFSVFHLVTSRYFVTCFMWEKCPFQSQTVYWTE